MAIQNVSLPIKIMKNMLIFHSSSSLPEAKWTQVSSSMAVSDSVGVESKE